MSTSACSWGAFDDLKDQTWVRLVDRDDAQNAGDFGINVIAVPLPAGKQGVSFVLGVGAGESGRGRAGAGLAQATFDGRGELVEQLGYDASENGQSGVIVPLKFSTTPFGLAPYRDGAFVVGAPDMKTVILYEPGLRNGQPIGMTAEPSIGQAVACGNLGLGSTAPDVVAVIETSPTPGGVAIFKAGSVTPYASCAFDPPQTTGTPPVVPVSSVVIAAIDGDPGRQQIVTSGVGSDGKPRIYILDAAQVLAAGGDACPAAAGFEVPGPRPPVELAVADVNGNGRLDIVAGWNGAPVRVYLDVARGAAPAAEEIAPGPDSSNMRGTQIAVGDVIGDAAPEIIIGDAGASPAGVSAAGEVEIVRLGTDGCADRRGAACLVKKLWVDDGKQRRFFGRGLAVGDFTSSKGTTRVLAVARKDQLLVYYKLEDAQPDPRD